MSRTIECPDCGREVTLDANGAIRTHDNIPPMRSVCRASGADASRVVAMLDKAIAAERERAAAELAVLTERVEAAIAEACAAVRARTIEECESKVPHVLTEVRAERERQALKWGSAELQHDLAQSDVYASYGIVEADEAVRLKHSAFDDGVGDWVRILVAEAARFATAALNQDSADARRFAVRVGAVSVAIVESIDAAKPAPATAPFVASTGVCHPDVFKLGTLVFMTHSLRKADAEAWCQKVAATSGQPVDWYYAGGRIAIKALGDLARVRAAMRELMPEHDAVFCAEYPDSTSVPPRPAWWDDDATQEPDRAPRIDVVDGQMVLVDPDAAELITALATPTPASEPAPVDPAAGALR
jgi:hypothetical protein